MNCQNCGAPMEGVRDGGYFFCRYCTSFYYPEANDDYVRSLGELSGDDCPVCHEQLVTGAIKAFEGAQVLLCENCQGLLLDQQRFATVIRYLRVEHGADGPPRPLNFQELEREIDCPHCTRPMSTYPYAGPGNVVIDSCVRCRVIWLDSGELSKIAAATARSRRRRSHW